MRDVFISHAEEDAHVALAIASGLQGVGYTTWCYEEDSDVGFSYLSQIDQEIEETQVVVLIISPHSLASDQVTKELIRAHESGKPFLPVRRNIAHELVQQRREWRMALGAAVSIPLPPEGVPGLMPRLLRGLDRLGVTPNGQSNAAAPGANTDTNEPWRVQPLGRDRARMAEVATPPTPWSAPRPLEQPVSSAVGAATWVAAAIGLVGLVLGLLNFTAALSPQNRPESWVYQVAPWLQTLNLLTNFGNVAFNGAILLGVWRAFQGDGGGPRLIRTGALGLLVLTGAWFLLSLVGLTGADRWSQVPDSYRAGAVSTIVGYSLIAGAMAGSIFALFRRAPRPRAA